MPLLQNLIGQALSATAPEQTNPDMAHAIPVTPDAAAQALGYDTADKAREAGFNIPNETHYYHAQTGENLTATANGISPQQRAQQDIASGTQPMQEVLPMKTPGFWQRFVNPEAAKTEQDINRQYQLSPLLSQRATETQLSNARQIGNYMGNNLAVAGGRLPNPTDEAVGRSSGVGALQSGIAPDAPIHYGVAGRELSKGIIPLLAQTGVNQATTQDILGQGQLQASPFVASNTVSEARDVMPRELMAREVAAQYPGLGSSSIMMGAINPESGDISSVPNPVRSLQGVMLGGMLPGMTGQSNMQTITLPSGKRIQVQGAAQSPLHVTPLSYYQGEHAEQPPTETEGTRSTNEKERRDTIVKLLSNPQLPHGLKFELLNTLDRLQPMSTSTAGSLGGLLGNKVEKLRKYIVGE
jgi:hypothetical protein